MLVGCRSWSFISNTATQDEKTGKLKHRERKGRRSAWQLTEDVRYVVIRRADSIPGLGGGIGAIPGCHESVRPFAAACGPRAKDSIGLRGMERHTPWCGLRTHAFG